MSHKMKSWNIFQPQKIKEALTFPLNVTFLYRIFASHEFPTQSPLNFQQAPPTWVHQRVAPMSKWLNWATIKNKYGDKWFQVWAGDKNWGSGLIKRKIMGLGDNDVWPQLFLFPPKKRYVNLWMMCGSCPTNI